MKTVFKSLFLLLVISFFSIEISAQTKLSVQGVIRLSDGNAVDDGLYPITFKLYDTIVGGNLLWTEIQPTLKVTSGIYSTILGEVTPLDLEFNEFYFLSLTVDGEELLPRAPLTSAPYSNSVLGFDNIFPSTGDVGIGTLNPTHKLEVEGDASISGWLGIGTDTAIAALHVEGGFYLDGTGSGNGTAYMEARGNNGELLTVGIVGGSGDAIVYQRANQELIFGTDDTQRMLIHKDGNVGIGLIGGNTVPSHLLHVNGVARSTQSTWATSSDKRVKQNIKLLSDGSLNKIMHLKPVNYQWKKEYKNNRSGLKENNTGFIAQEIEEIFPDMVSIVKEDFGNNSIEDFRVLNIGDLPVHLVKAMQEQQRQIEVLKSENQKLKKTLTSQSEASNIRLSQLEDKLNYLLQIQSVSKL
jgi:hypothetical protein